MLESIFVCPDYDGRDQLPIKQWIKAWSKILLKKVEESGKERDQVIHIIKHMIKMKPEERYDADQCLRKGCENDLFKKRSDGEIVDTDDTTEDEATTGVTDAGTKISTTDQGLGSGERTPTERSAQMTVSATSEAPTVLAGDLWAGDDGGGRKSDGIDWAPERSADIYPRYQFRTTSAPPKDVACVRLVLDSWPGGLRFG